MSISGIGVSPGSAHGRAVVVSTVKITPPGERTDDPAAATEAVTAALGAVAAEMEVRAAKATEKAKPVLEATAMLARDPSLLSTATGRIAEGLAADLVVLDADPVDNIQVLTNQRAIRAVIQAGRIVRADLPENED